MRILHVIASANPETGGPIEGVRQRGIVLQGMGHEVEIASCDAPDGTWGKDFPLPLHTLGPGKGGYQHSPKLYEWLYQNGPRFDAVIANGIWQFPSYAVRKAMLRLKKPYFVFTHGMLDPWFKKAYPLKHLKKSLYWPLGEYRVLRDAAAVLFTCEEEKELARQSFRLYKANERVVRYGTSAPTIDTAQQISAFLEAFPQLKDQAFLLFLSRIHPKKGVDVLIQAFAKVYRGSNVRLVIAGPDQVGVASELKQLAETLGVANQIVWTGMLSGNLKWGAYHACDVLVLPSHQENFGIVVAEALACAKPVLISNKVNIWREIQAEKAGLVDADTVDGTTRLLQSWSTLTTPEKAVFSTNAQRCFWDHFEIKGSAESLVKVMQEYLK